MNETGASAAAAGVNGHSWTVTGSGTNDNPTGHVEDPEGTTNSRGYVEPANGLSNNIYFANSQNQGDIFDVRGQTSCTFAGWFYIKPSEPSGSGFFYIHDPASTNGQAMWSWCRHPTLGSNPAPGWGMLSGDSLFDHISLQATDTVAVQTGVWQFTAGGYDAANNKVFHFWGRAENEHYYNSTDGFADGFGYSANSGVAALGLYNATGSEDGVDAETAFDHCMWWNGRALTEDELVFLWNNHLGRSVDDLFGAFTAVADILDVTLALPSADVAMGEITAVAGALDVTLEVQDGSASLGAVTASADPIEVSLEIPDADSVMGTITAVADSLEITLELPIPSDPSQADPIEVSLELPNVDVTNLLTAVADPLDVVMFMHQPIAFVPPPFTFPRVPARHYGGRVNIHPIGAPRYADHKAEIEAYGFTITEEKHLAGQTTLLVHGPRSAIFALMQSPTADEERLERPWVFWPLTEGDELSPATIAAGATRPPGAGLITS